MRDDETKQHLISRLPRLIGSGVDYNDAMGVIAAMKDLADWTRRPLEMDMMTHWGLDVASEAEVDRAHANAEEHKDEYGIQKIMPPANQHGVYSFFMQDLDNNWWEVQHPPEPDHTDWYLKRGERPNDAP